MLSPKSRAAAAFSWGLLALFGLFLALNPGESALRFSIAIPILLLIFSAHESLRPKSGVLWSMGAFLACAALPFFLWKRLDGISGALIFIHFAIAVYLLKTASLFYGRIAESALLSRNKISELREKLKSAIREE